MTRRLIIALLLIPAFLVGTAASATAAQPGIRSTKEYQQLKSFVAVMVAKKGQTVTPAQISAFKDTLAKRRAKADGKVRSIYQTALGNAKEQRQNARNRVRNLRQDGRAEIAALRQNRQQRLQSLATDHTNAVNRINNTYGTKIDNLQKDLRKLQRKLDRTTLPSARKVIKADIATTQDQIDTQQRARQNDLNLENSKYRTNVQTVKENFASQISRLRAKTTRTVREAQAALRENFQARREAAQSRRASQMGDVRALYERGVQAIKDIKVD